MSENNGDYFGMGPAFPNWVAGDHMPESKLYYECHITIEPDRTLKLNSLSEMGTVDDLSPLSAKLTSIFEERTRLRAYRSDMFARLDLPEHERIEKTVFIKAPRGMKYGEVIRVMDGLKATGASPIGLQLDALN